MAKLFQKVQEFVEKIEKNDGKPLYELTPKEARQVLLEVQKTAQDNEALSEEVTRDEIEVTFENGRKLKLEIVKPRGAETSLPVIYYIHGGGWVMGDNVTHARLVAELATGVPAAVVFPLYKQAPEGQFPEVTEDLFKGLKYITEVGEAHGLDTTRLAVAGDSVGGNMAAVMTFMAKENGFLPQIDFQLLLYPVTNAEFSTNSYNEFADGPWLTKKAMQWFWDKYLSNKQKRLAKEASPLKATLEELKGLPPALVVLAENDVLRDEGEAYARLLDLAGVKTFAVCFYGTIHDFLMLNDLSETAPTRAAMSLVKAKLKWFLYYQK